MNIPIEYLRECFTLDESGALIWKDRPASHFSRPCDLHDFRRRFAGTKAGRLSQHGYCQVNVTYQGKPHKIFAHRIVWAIATGNWPKQCIDHINHIRTDNRPCNLRDVSHAENMQNVSGRTNNPDLPPTGLEGVYRCQKRAGFRSQISISRRIKYLGWFPTAEAAHAAFTLARQQRDAARASNGTTEQS